MQERDDMIHVTAGRAAAGTIWLAGEMPGPHSTPLRAVTTHRRAGAIVGALHDWALMNSAASAFDCPSRTAAKRAWTERSIRHSRLLPNQITQRFSDGVE